MRLSDSLTLEEPVKPRVVHTDRVPPGRARISQAVVHGDTVYVSGMVARDPATGKTVPGGIAEQTRQVLENIKSVVNAAGSSMSHVVKTSCFIGNFDDFEKFNAVWESYFPEDPPARICVETRLGPGFLIEIEAIAALAS
jgi:2-iminobutanoate/2-iminopropanoate deaminase